MGEKIAVVSVDALTSLPNPQILPNRELVKEVEAHFWRVKFYVVLVFFILAKSVTHNSLTDLP